MTNILQLPLVNIRAVAGTDEDWIDAIAISDASGAPLDLAGIAVTLDISSDGALSLLTASTANGRLSLVQGAGASVNNVLLINVPAAAKTALTAGAYKLSGLASADGHLLDVIVGALTIRQSF